VDVERSEKFEIVETVDADEKVVIVGRRTGE
jgi:hypothetical protein